MRTTGRHLTLHTALSAILMLMCLLAANPALAAASDEAPFRFFAAGSPWNQPLPKTAPLSSSSAQFIGGFSREVGRELETDQGPSISTTSYSAPIYTVPADQPTVSVQLVSRFAVPALSAAWSAVPLPPSAVAAEGKDRHLLLWQPSSDRLWEFWHLFRTSTGWQAGWGGAMQNVSSNFGVYDDAAWPGATEFWGASASSLSIAGGLITIEDLRRGEINHALAIGVPKVRAGEYAAPAERTDGESTSPTALPEGAHLRLDPSLELWKLHLPPLTLMLAKAAKRYGIFVRDKAADVTFYAQDPTPTGRNPYTGPNGFFEGTYPARLLSAFPWTHLQLLQMQLADSGS